ncbi:MAG: hypothetical protein GC178_18355 [Flavobacteriales bacterium]|nr:hypothetical protein [Flavobacteriales bacterium]
MQRIVGFMVVVCWVLLSGIHVFGQPLARYSCVVDRLDIEGFENDTSKQFDARNIVQLEGNYHPVSICYYGILCLNEYEQTGNEEYLQKAKNQLSYFLDKNLVHELFDGKGIGLPYLTEHNDLQPPWYSGMAQGLGISFLLRYAAVTKDTSVYPTVEKLAYTLLMPQEKGGCLSRTPENLLWIEEYPNSPQSPEVLNGFMFGLFGLMDYCLIYRTDARAIRILEECLVSLRTALPYYDQRSWTKYNQRPLYPNRPHYIRLQIFQLMQLHQMLSDPFYLRQLCIWSAMLYNKEPNASGPWIHFTDQPFSIVGNLTKTEIETQFSDNVVYDSFEAKEIEGKAVRPFPWYGFVTTQETFVDRPKTLFVEIDSTVSEVHILYRYHWDEALFEEEKWQAQNGVSEHKATFQLQPGHYQFAIFYSNDDFRKSIGVSRFEVMDR